MNEPVSKILVIDDEQDILEILEFNLTHEGYEVTTATSAEEALELLDDSYHLILLDVMMGGMSGFKMADQLRKAGNHIPIVFLTAKDTENDMLTGFMLGGDDYIRKPFSMQELKARVRSLLRRVHQQEEPEEDQAEGEILSCGPLTIDQESMTITDEEGKSYPVTKTEYDILLLLATNPDRVFSRQEILSAVWRDDSIVLDRTVDVHIARLRKKLGEHGTLIVNRVGFGYLFKLPRK